MTTLLEIYRPGVPPTLQTSINIDEKTVYLKKLEGDNAITSEIISAIILPVQIGDFITFNNEDFLLSRLPGIEKINNNTYKYNIRFEGVDFNLSKKLFISSDLLADFSYNGTATDFITNIVASVNEIDPGWSVGSAATTTEQTLQFTNESCLAALKRVGEAFKLEYSLSGKVISLVKSVGSTTAYKFQYGRNLGLYKLERQQVSDQNVLTKVFGYGSQKNIPYTYRSGAKRLVFESAGLRYLTKNTDLYGTIEGQFTDDNIFPQRTGILSGVNYAASAAWNANTDYLTDSAIDFDLNDYKIDGKGLGSIVFKSGDLSGVECEIWKYDNATKRFYITPFTDSDGYIQPNTSNHPHTGDSYTIVNISMPQSYIDTAEAALQAATQAFIDENSVPMVVYTCDIDPKYASSIGLVLNAGDKVTVVDTDLGINSLIRVSAIEFPLVNPYQIKAVIADFVPYTLQERIIKAAISNKKETVFVDRRQSELARRNTVNEKALKDMIFDTDLYFDATRIKPLSIETMYLSVGSRSSDFWLSNTVIKTNYLGDINRFYISAGSLVHLEIEITGLGHVWVIATPLDQAALNPALPYYLYAKCSKTALTGVWILSTAQIAVEQTAGYYHFLVGMLFAVADGYRDSDFAKGKSYIHGDQIRTGNIESIDGENYLNLTEGKFKVGDGNSSLDWNVTAANVLTLRGALVQTNIGALPVTVFLGTYSAGVTYQKGNQVTYSGSSWNYINATPGSGHTPAEDAYWTKSAAAGATGATGATGNTGAAGAVGAKGPAINFRGDFDWRAYYFNNSLVQDVVRNGSTYYFYIGTDNASNTWVSGNWQSFGSSWSSVATELLLATYATIANLKVEKFEGVPDNSGFYKGGIKIENNQIWEDSAADDASGWLLLNYKGYHGGGAWYRNTMIGDGKGNSVLIANRDRVTLSRRLYADAGLNTSGPVILDLPTSDPHVNGQLWKSGSAIYSSNG